MSRFQSALPPFDRGSWPWLALALLLAATLAFQVAVPLDLALPVAGPMRGGVSGTTMLPVPPSSGAGAGGVVRSGLFTPPALPTGSSANGVGATAAGPVVLGSIGIGARRFALVQTEDGQVGRVSPGGAIGGWRLRDIGAGGVRLAHGKDSITVPFGAHVSTPPRAAEGIDT